MYIYILDISQFDYTFALVQTIGRSGTMLTTVPNRWTSLSYYPVDQDSATFGNDMVRWPSMKKPHEKKCWEMAITDPSMAPDLSNCSKFRCKVKASKLKSYAEVRFNDYIDYFNVY